MARCPFARWRGPVPNMTPHAMQHPARGLVLHVEVGTEEGTNSWFHNPKAQASADFGIGKDGTLDQWVDTADKAWAEAFYNPYWYSVETEGMPGDPLTAAQVNTCARLLVWLAHLDGFPIQVTDDPNGHGLITHGLLGAKGGGHYGCPGAKRAAQRADIVRRALDLAPTPPKPSPPAPPPSAHLDLGGTVMPATFLNVPLDGNGNGWLDFDPGTPVSVAVATKQGPNPPVDGYDWGGSPKSCDVSAQVHDGKARVTVRGGIPGGHQGVFVAAG